MRGEIQFKSKEKYVSFNHGKQEIMGVLVNHASNQLNNVNTNRKRWRSVGEQCQYNVKLSTEQLNNVTQTIHP